MNKILVILNKEWLEIRQQRTLLLTILLLPLLFTLIAAGTFIAIGILPNIGKSGTLNTLPSSALAGLSSIEMTQAIVGLQLSLLYVLLPIVITSVIASYSIVGEKTSRTLEPLLATPIRTWELLLGKSLSALLPAIVATWLAGGLFILCVALFSLSARVFAVIVSPAWLIVFLLWTPLLALIGIAVMVAVSSRVNDPRTAQQFSIFLVLPIIALIIGQVTGLYVLGPVFALAVFLLLVLLAILAIWIVTRLFQREVILTRWK
jgi:ABC-2 type transport system permease protein